MNVNLVAELVRAGHQFVGLSPESIRKLAELRQFFALVPQVDSNRTDPHTGKISADDDALIDAIYAAIANNTRTHRKWDADCLMHVALNRVTVTSNNIGRPDPHVARGAPVTDHSNTSPRRTITSSSTKAGDEPSHTATSAQDARDTTTAGGMRVFDLPMQLSCVTGMGTGPAVALTQHGLTGDCVHRCTIQVVELPPLDAAYQPACTFGVTTPDVLADAACPWLGLTWRVGTSLPCAAHVNATNVHDQPTLRGADGHVFIHVGDVITMELRPREPVARGGMRRYEALYAEQEGSLSRRAASEAAVDAYFFVNGKHVGVLQGAEQFQPIAPNNKYRSDAIEDDKGKVRRPRHGFQGCRFGVQLCPGAGVVVYDLELSKP
jgi:hypothetical protein